MSYGVLIIESEAGAQKPISELVDWAGLDLRCVGTFASPEAAEAGEALLERTDIVISDCCLTVGRIPGFLRSLHEFWPLADLILIGGGRDYDALKAAISAGAVEYVPEMSAAELNSALKSLLSARSLRIRESSKPHRHDLLYDYLSLNSETLEEPSKLFNWHPGVFQILDIIIYPHSVYSSFLLERKVECELAPLCFEYESFRMYKSLFLALNFPEENSGKIDSALVRISQWSQLNDDIRCSVTIGAGLQVKDISELPKSFESAKKIMEARVVAPNLRLFNANYGRYKELSQIKLSISLEDRAELQRCVRSMDFDRLERWVYDYMAANKAVFERARQLIYKLGTEIVNITFQEIEAMGMDAEKTNLARRRAANEFYRCDSGSKLIKVIRDELGRMLRELGLDTDNKKKQYVVEAMKYIDAHYMDNLTLEQLAGRMYISPVHLSRLFKKELTINYSSYLTKVRIDRAKSLLSQDGLSVCQVAAEVGYDNSRYFSRLFQKKTGLRPSEYRQKYRNPAL